MLISYNHIMDLYKTSSYNHILDLFRGRAAAADSGAGGPRKDFWRISIGILRAYINNRGRTIPT
jgi:hypothetical protein